MITESVAIDTSERTAPVRANHHGIALYLRNLASFPAMMAVLIVGLALVGAQSRLIDPDTWWHITAGDQILKTHTWPTSDTYSFTASGAAWIAYEWLGEVFMALAARAGGLAGLALFQKALVVALTLLLFYYAWLRSANSKAACVASVILLPVAPVVFTLRPQLMGYVFLVLTLICLEQFQQGHDKSLWFLPLLFVVWANIHGTFVFGLVVIGLYWVTGLVSFQAGRLTATALAPKRRVKLLLTLLACLLAILVTPYGSQIAANPIEMATAQPLNIAHIQEWQPLSLSNPLGTYILFFAVVLFIAQVTLRIQYRLEELAMLVFGLYAACAHLRFAMIFVLFVIPVVARILTQWIPPYDASIDKPLLNIVVIVVVLVAMIKFRPSTHTIEKAVASDYPAYAVEYLRQHPQNTGMFNEYGWGGYLIWQLSPEHKVFIDGRADLYEYSGLFPDYMAIISAQSDALRVLARHNIQSCLVRRNEALDALLTATPEWKQVYSDDVSAIFVRQPSHKQLSD
jgi:hypothetical protein